MAAAIRAESGPILQLSAPLAADEVISYFDVAPDGRTAVYNTARVLKREPASISWLDTSVYSVPISGGTARQLNRPQFDDAYLRRNSDSERAFTPDSRYMIFSGIQEEPGQVGIYLASLDGSSFIRLTEDSSTTGYFRHELTPDGSSVILQEHFGGALDSVPIAGGPATTLYAPSLPDAWVMPGQISSDSSRLVFTSGTAGIPSNWAMFSIRPDGTDLLTLVDKEVVDYATITSDGQTVVFSKRTDLFSSVEAQYYSVPIDGGPITELLSLPSGGSPRFVPSSTGDQSVILYGRSEPDKSYDLYLVPLSGGTPIQLNSRQMPDEYVQYETATSDGRYAIYRTTSLTADLVGVYRASLDGGPVMKLSQDLPPGSHFGGILLNPDESQLLYMADIGDGEHNKVFAVSIDGTNHHQIIPQQEPGARIEDYYFSSDGKFLAYLLSPKVGGDELYLMPSTGGPSVRISPVADTAGYGVRELRVVGNWAVFTYGASLDDRFLYAVQIPEPATSFLAILAALLVRPRRRWLLSLPTKRLAK